MPVDTKRLGLSNVIGTSSNDGATFVVVDNLLAYVAGAGVVVSRISDDKVQHQRFFCAKSGGSSNQQYSSSSANSYLNMIQGLNLGDIMKKQYDSFGYAVGDELLLPEMIYGDNSYSGNLDSTGSNINGNGSNGVGNGIGHYGPNFKPIDDKNSSPSKLANKIRTISCITISPDKRLLAVGESGYQPRILIYSLADDSSCNPVYMIQDHRFGISKMRFSPNGKKLASLGLINDGYLNIWDLTKKAKISTNKCSSVVNLLIWETNILMTIGVRHIKVWFANEIDQIVEDEQIVTNNNNNNNNRVSTLKGKNVLLNEFLNSNFIDASPINAESLLVLSDQGDLCLLEMDTDQFSLHKTGQVFPNTNGIIVDEGKLWLSSDLICSVQLDDILSSINTDKAILKRSLSVNKVRRRPIIAVYKYNNGQKLIYLNENGDIKLFDCESSSSRLLVSSMIKKVGGCKKCFNGDLVIWSKDGIVKRATSIEVSQLEEEIQLQTNELILNELTCYEMNKLGEMYAGDKFGNLMIYKDHIKIKSIKAHESSITGMVYFEMGTIRFLVTISRDRTIQVFVTEDNGDEWDLLQTLSLHKGTLTDVLYHDGRIFVSSTDRTVSVHRILIKPSEIVETRSKTNDDAAENELCEDFQTKLQIDERVEILQEKIISDKSTPIAMNINQDELIISSQDRNLSIYKIGDKIEKWKNMKLYNEMNESVLVDKFVIYNTDLMFVFSNDKSLRCFQYHTGKQLSINWGHSEQIVGLFQIEEEEDKLISIGNDGCLFIWDHHHQQKRSQDISLPSSPTPSSYYPPAIVERVTRKVKTTTLSVSPISTRKTIRSQSSSPSKLTMNTKRNLSITSSTTTVVTPTGSPTKLRASTLHRLSQPPNRSPLKEINNKTSGNNNPGVVSTSGMMTLVEVVKFSKNLEQSLIEKKFNKSDLQLIKLEIGNIWKLLNEDDELKMLEEYSDKLLKMMELKLNK